MNARIVAGSFCGADIEPGVFHVRVEDDPNSGDPKDDSVAPAESPDA